MERGRINERRVQVGCVFCERGSVNGEVAVAELTECRSDGCCERLPGLGRMMHCGHKRGGINIPFQYVRQLLYS